jgi:hypothetical protein
MIIGGPAVIHVLASIGFGFFETPILNRTRTFHA